MIYFLVCTLLSIVVQSIFALFEMACISFNKIRLQYYVNIGRKQAIRLNYLLHCPSRLFATTLIGIHTSLQIGSECSRRFYQSIHLNPDWAPLSQCFIVIVFAELTPLFIAMRHPEQVAMALSPIMTKFSRLLTPIIWAFDLLSKCIHRLIGQPSSTGIFLSREEVGCAFEAKEGEGDELHQTAKQIFQLKNYSVEQMMIPLIKVQMVPSTATLADVRHLLSIRYVPFLPIYHRYQRNVVGIVHLRDLLRSTENQHVIDFAKSPWFVTQNTSVLQILDQFKKNNQNAAVVIDASGQSCGLLTLEDIISNIFGKEGNPSSKASSFLYIERTLSGDMEIVEFNQQFQSNLKYTEQETISDLIIKTLDHVPITGESLRIDSYLFTVLESSLRGIKTVAVQSIQE